MWVGGWVGEEDYPFPTQRSVYPQVSLEGVLSPPPNHHISGGKYFIPTVLIIEDCYHLHNGGEGGEVVCS